MDSISYLNAFNLLYDLEAGKEAKTKFLGFALAPDAISYAYETAMAILSERMKELGRGTNTESSGVERSDDKPLDADMAELRNKESSEDKEASSTGGS